MLSQPPPTPSRGGQNAPIPLMLGRRFYLVPIISTGSACLPFMQVEPARIIKTR
jgi:hypothetical protein